MRFDKKRMEDYGFINKDKYFVLERNFMGDDFTAEIMVRESGEVSGRVIDVMNEEEYVQLRMPNYNGAYVGAVRAEYEAILLDIAEKCCNEVNFASDQSNRIAAEILERYAVEPDFPWDDDGNGEYGVFRHPGSRKWFGLIMNIDRRLLDRKADKKEKKAAGNEGQANKSAVMVDVINLKADEFKTEALHKIPGIYPAYHMNHKKWISVVLDDELSDSDVLDLVDISYRLTSGGAGVLNEAYIREVLSIADSIPPGRVASYGQIAEMTGRPKNSRLVGRIMSMADRYGEHPCHRVVNHAGRTVPGWEEQRGLLEAEGVEFKANGCVDMDKFRMI